MDKRTLYNLINICIVAYAPPLMLALQKGGHDSLVGLLYVITILISSLIAIGDDD